MSRPEDPRKYEVGYAKPPREHQFKKGRSGNPKGRPRKSAPKFVVPLTLNKVILAEAERQVTLREGDELVQITVRQALPRAINVAAMKGDSRAQKLAVQMLSEADREQKEERLRLFEEADKYKVNWEKEAARCKSQRLPPPEPPFPHPDDIIVNPRTGEVSFVGPMTPKEKALMDERIQFRDKLIEQLNDPAEWEWCSPNKREMARAILKKNRIDPLDDLLPPRCRSFCKLLPLEYPEERAEEGEPDS